MYLWRRIPIINFLATNMCYRIIKHFITVKLFCCHVLSHLLHSHGTCFLFETLLKHSYPKFKFASLLQRSSKTGLIKINMRLNRTGHARRSVSIVKVLGTPWFTRYIAKPTNYYYKFNNKNYFLTLVQWIKPTVHTSHSLHLDPLNWIPCQSSTADWYRWVFPACTLVWAHGLSQRPGEL